MQVILTRRLVDVSQDVIVREEDCGTLRGIEVSALKKNDEVVETLAERIVGRTALNDVVDPISSEKILSAGEEITEDKAEIGRRVCIKSIEVRSPLTCESKKGICVKCYGRNLGYW